MLVALLALTGLFVALYLTLYKMGIIGHLSCSVGSCETVNTSRWATFLGLPVAAWGLGFYVATLGVAMAGTSERYEDSRTISLALVAMSGWGVVFSAWLTYLELFVINAICMWCIVSAIIVTMIFLVSVLDLREHVRRGGIGFDTSPSGPPADSSAEIRRV
jgi:uncharacterized membrane protein